MGSDGSNPILTTNKQWPQWMCTISASLGCFCAGLCLGWSSPSMAILQSDSSPFPVTSNEISWIASLLQFGAALGPIPGAIICKYFGLKMCILLSIIPYSCGFLLIMFAESPVMLYAARVISGLAVGLSYASTPIYISEISENSNRGGLMVIFSLSLNTGIVFATGVAPYVSIKIMAGIMLIFPLLLLSFVLAPESPLYYLRINEEAKAINSLKFLRRQTDVALLKNELDSMKMNTVDHMNLIDCFKEFFMRSNMKAFFIVVLTIFAQQSCGSLPAMLYLENIYLSADMNFPANIAVLITMALILVFCFVFISLPDKFGRKRLLLFSAAGCIVSNAMLGIFFIVNEYEHNLPNFGILAIFAMNALEISATLGLNPVPYIIAGEIFSANVKEIGLCVISMIGALFGFLMTKLFQIAVDTFGTGIVFLGLMFIVLIFAVCIYLFVPETSGKSFNEIQEMLKSSIFHSSEQPTSESVENIFEYNSKSNNRF